MTKPHSFKYRFFGGLGWLMLIGGILTMLFLALAEGPLDEKYAGIGVSLGLVVIGILLAQIAEKNIFKVLVNVLDDILTIWV